jgi:hypothetical protein
MNNGAEALTDNPYSVILKLAKNTETTGRVDVTQLRPADSRPTTRREYVSLFRDSGHIEAH